MNTLEEIIGYKFIDENLLKKALTHPSYSDIHNLNYNYEMLEFLGDAVLQLAVTHFLMDIYQDENEGDLARRRAALICKSSLAEIAKKAELDKYMLLSDGEDKSGGRDNPGNLENTLEAIIGAIYLDGGLKCAKDFVWKFFEEELKSKSRPPINPKSELQEWAQSFGSKPVYVLEKQDGPGHSRVFTVSVEVGGYGKSEASGVSKKEAEKKAARKFIEKFINQ